MKNPKKDFRYKSHKVTYWNNGFGLVFNVSFSGKIIPEIDGEKTYYETEDQLASAALESIDFYLQNQEYDYLTR